MQSENLREQNEKLKQKLDLAKKVLQDIINGCVNPDIAIRRVMLDLKPIRNALKKLEENE